MGIPKLAVFDVDGTLVDYDGSGLAENRDALQRLRSAGTSVAIATGRPAAILDETLAEIGDVDYAVCSNGATITSMATGERLRDIVLPADLIEGLVTSVRTSVPGVGTALELGAELLEETGFARRVPPSSHDAPIDDVLEAFDATTASVHRVIFFHDDYDRDLPALAAHIQPHLAMGCDVFHGVMLPIVEVVPAGNDKAAALDVLAGHLGIDACEAMAFGDGLNDIEMLQWAGTGVAMANAHDDAKAIANAVAGQVADGGVAHFINALFNDQESSR